MTTEEFRTELRRRYDAQPWYVKAWRPVRRKALLNYIRLRMRLNPNYGLRFD